MLRSLRLSLLWTVSAAVAAPPSVALAQERFRVLIPDVQPLEGASKKFGEKVAEELRALVGTLATHQSIERKELERSLKEVGLKLEELDCVRTRQLAARIDAPVALCASYSGTRDAYTVAATFWDVASGEAFEIEPTTAAEKEEKAVAEHIFRRFDRYQRTVRSAAICRDYAASRQWDHALENCDTALALNPGAVGTRYLRARILFDAERHAESLEELERVLEANPAHEDALQLSGYISATLGEDDQALAYYARYLELSPGSATVRMKIAYELAQAGDPKGAMQLIRAGLDVDPDNIDLLEQFGGFAFASGTEVQQAGGARAEDAGAVSPQAAEYFRQAIEAYKKVFAARGAETPVGELRSVVAAHIQLGELPEAIATCREVLATHPDEHTIWSMYADALQRTGDLPAAIAALDHAVELDPSNTSYRLRKGKWLVEEGRTDEAVAVLGPIGRADAGQADIAARMFFADAYAKGVQQSRYDYAVTVLSAAELIPNLSTEMRQQLAFWHGYSIYQAALEEQKPSTLATANATLPKFREALRLLQQVGDYPGTVNVNIEQFLTGVSTYIEIQEAIIKRGR